jgi:hypothetical protein
LRQRSVSCNYLLILRKPDHLGFRFKIIVLRNPVTVGHIDASDLSLLEVYKLERRVTFDGWHEKYSLSTPFLWSRFDKVFNSGLTLLSTQPLLLPTRSPTHPLHLLPSSHAILEGKKGLCSCSDSSFGLSLIASTSVRTR